MTFLEYLHEQHHKENPCVLDDDLPDAFSEWITEEVYPDELIDYAQRWHAKESLTLIERLRP